MFSESQDGAMIYEEFRSNNSLKRKWMATAVLTAAVALHGCASTGGESNGAQRGMQTFGRGVVNLVLSPFMIVSGLAQGLAFLPYTIGTGLDELNQGLIKAQAVSLEDSYRATYGVSIHDVRVDQETGEVSGENFGFGRHRPEAMLEATRAFQRLLMAQGMAAETAQQYALVGDYTHVRTRGHILLAVVHRNIGAQPFRVASKHTGIVTTFRPEQQGWANAYQRDADGAAIDEVIDWAAIDYSALQRDKVVATLMVIAAESVKAEKRSPDYWAAEKRWLNGESARLMEESGVRVKSALAAR